MSNTTTDNAELKARIKDYLMKFREDHLQELYPSGGIPQQDWVYEALAEFVQEEVIHRSLNPRIKQNE
jgi:hypothetical protein